MPRQSSKPHRQNKSMRLEQLENRQLLAADLTIFHNTTEPLDVNNDAVVSAVDALRVVNELNFQRDGNSPRPDGFLDVNNDRALTPVDALMVINGINERQRVPETRRDNDGVNPPRLEDGTPDSLEQNESENRNGPPQDSSPRPRGGPIPGDTPDRDAGPNVPGDRREQPGPAPAPNEPEFASFDGTGNNIEDPELGSTHESFSRWIANAYEDELGEPSHADWASAREVSNAVNSVPTDLEGNPQGIENARGLTDLTWLFGQFIDHDITLSGEGDGESFDIEVPAGDPYFDPFFTGEQTIGLTRSGYTEVDSVREQFNEISAYIDGSVIYGSNEERAHALRSFEGGRLATSEGDLLPFNEAGLANAGGTSDSLFLAGDIRANENSALAAMHTIWVREHNRVADRIAESNSELSDEEIYQRARQFVTAELQAITYNEFLPAILGEDAISEYSGYDATVDPSISNVFATAAYRFGHTMLSSELLRLNEDGTVADEGNLSLQNAFFNVGALTENGVDSLLRGAATQVAQEVDPFLVDDVRNFPFGPPGSGGFDLAALNIQRGRDHGLADYNTVRVEMGLDPVGSFADISSDPAVQERLASVYSSVDEVDAWVGMLAEDHVEGSSLGNTAGTIIAKQFEAIRDGDRFYYENVFSGRQLRDIENTTLASIIERNSGVDFDRGDNAFFAEEVDNDLLADNRNRPRGGQATPPIQSPGIQQDLVQDRAMLELMQERRRRLI